MRRHLARGVLLAIGTAVCTGANAAGFALTDKSVSGLGAGMAGEASYAEDASTIYGNPAGMMSLTGRNVTAGINHLTTTARFTDDGSTVSGTASGDNDAETVANIPTFYYVQEVSPDMRLGFGIYAPFGLGLKYDDDWIGRYHTIDTNIRTINLSPAIAVRVTPALNVGATVDFQYMDAAMKTAVDFGTICYGVAPPAFCLNEGFSPGNNDGYNKLEGDSWATGFTLGLTYALSTQTQLGAVYHSQSNQNLKGTSKFEDVPAQLAGAVSDSNANVDVRLPASASIGINHALTDRLRLLAGYTWTGWSSYDELCVEHADGSADTVSAEDWNDASRYSLGALYQLNPSWLLRAGFFYDQTPVPDVEHRTPRLPDTDRRWMTLGARWSTTPDFSVDMALAYVNENDIPINRVDSVETYGPGAHTLKGTYQVTGTYASMQASWKF